MTDNKDDLKAYYTAGLPVVHLMLLLATLGLVATIAIHYLGF